MRALVTGAAGFVGSNLALALESRGHSVVGLDNFTTGNFENLDGFSGDFIAADIGDVNFWANRVGKIDAVFHQAAITDTTVSDQGRMMAVNVEAFRSLLNWAAKSKVKKFVYASSAGVYGAGKVPMTETDARRPLNIYAFSKMIMENVAADFQKSHPKMDIVGLRYFNVFGPREKFKNAASSMIWQLSLQMKAGRRPRIFERGEQFRDHIYVADVVKANIMASQKKARGVYNVCTGRKTDFNEIIAYLNGVLGTNLEPDYFKNPYSFYQSETLGDPARAARGLGFRSDYDPARGIAEYLGGRSTVLA
jgi:ADP-L-glycero-D-manno-heptose 6-epimerase